MGGKTKKEKMEVRAEGKEAFDALFFELSKNGLDQSQAVLDLLEKLKKVDKLEAELEVLKDLVSRAIKLKKPTSKAKTKSAKLMYD